MYNIRIPWRKVTFVNKNREFEEIVELSERTKKEITLSYKDKGTVISFTRGFITVPAERAEIADSVFSRAHNDIVTANMEGDN